MRYSRILISKTNTTELSKTLLQINKLQDNIIHEISKIYNRMSSPRFQARKPYFICRNGVNFNRCIKRYFDIFNDANFGMTISGKTQLGVIGGIGLVLILVFIFNKDSNT